MDWRAFMCPEQSTPLITARSGLTSKSLIIFNEGGSLSVWRVGATKWLASSNKICTLWLCYASKILLRLKCRVPPVWWHGASSRQFCSYLHSVWGKLDKINMFEHLSLALSATKLHYECWAITALKYTLMNKIRHQHHIMENNGLSQSDH